MKRALHLIALLFITLNIFAQAPNKMSYQAVIRNASNNLVTNAPVKMRISILQGSTSGTAVYSELHNPTTNANGLASIEIGGGTSPEGTIGSINWGNGTYFLKTETDPANGTNYTIVGTSQLLSVPYALQANNAGNGIKSVSFTGDTVYLDNGKKYIIPGIKDLNIPAPSTINDGLVGYWPFNGNANDESGNGNNGTVNGATLTTDRFGNSNKAYSFDGNNDFIEVANSQSLNNIDSISISGWLNIKAWGSQIVPGVEIENFFGFLYRYDLSSLPNITVGTYGVQLRETSPNSFWLKDKKYDISNSNPSFWNLNSWIHLAITAKNGEGRWYINGKLRGVISGELNGNYSPDQSIIIGGVKAPINTSSGFLDDIRIYNRALTEEEITYLANN